MPDSHDHGGHGEAQPAEEKFRYRGQDIRIVEGRGGPQLFIGDEEMDVEVTEDGVLSHDFMFQMFSSVQELAQALVKQRGTAKIKRGYDLAMLKKHHGHAGSGGEG